MRDDDFFIGWGPTPAPDRRFLMGAALVMLAGGAGLAATLAGSHEPAGPGVWAYEPVRSFTGSLVRAPYPAIVSSEPCGAPRTLLLATYGKTGLDARLASVTGDAVTIKGSLITRGANAMIAVPDDPDAIQPASASGAVAPPIQTDEGPATLVGEILDAKCWFGAMRPGAGKVHKSCASLCIHGGLPIVFCDAGCASETTAPVFLDENGRRHDTRLLPYAADPVLASGRMVRVGDVMQFRVALKDIRRL